MKSLVREVAAIIVLSVVLAITYNAFSSKGISLIRKAIQKVVISDSVLFPGKSVLIDTSASNSNHQNDSSKVQHSNANSSVGVLKIPATKGKGIYKIVSLAQVIKLLSQRRGIFLDARNPEEYEKGHIPGARNIPAVEVDQHIDQIAAIPLDTLIVIYCNNRDCHLGNMLADFLSVMEFKKLFLYEDGWDGWQNAKMPVDTSMINYGTTK
jgi:rhodanese-related sulfurtransferase